MNADQLATSLTVAPSTTGVEVEPADVLSGLASADRSLLALCIGLFEDSTLSRRLSERYAEIAKVVRKHIHKDDVRESAASVQSRMSLWLGSSLVDDDLRLVLWILLREAFHLPPRLTVSKRGAEVLATELAAAAVHAADPPGLLSSGKQLLSGWGWIEGEKRCVSLADIVLPVLHDLMATALKEGDGQMDAAAQQELISKTRKRLEQMSEDEQRRILDAVGAKDFNDAAIRQVLITGGGLTAFSAGVGVAGFSAYILAAQASAFIPLVSGPALVSVVAVISNPVTVVAATGGAIWWAVSSASEKARTAVGLRVLALLALQGLSRGERDWTSALAGFARIDGLRPHGDLDSQVIARYKADWQIVAPARPKPRSYTTPRTFELLARSALDKGSQHSRLARLLFPERGEQTATAAVAVLTLGDILYAAAAIDPTVIEAADFSHIDDIGDRFAFAEFAEKIHALSPAGYVGALSSLKGYVAERVVAAELVMQGHDVSFPDASNQAGWDLMVDGHEFQIKCLEHVSGLSDHFERYDFPVIANAELAGEIPAEWADKVFFVEGYSDQLVTHVTQTSLDAGDGMLHPHVPLFALGISALRNFGAYREGRISALQAVEQVVVDGGTRAGLAALGGYAGTTVGLLVFGPAGALVLGGVIPVLSQAQAGRVKGMLDAHIHTQRYRDWTERAHESVDAMCQSLNATVEEKLARLRAKWQGFGGGGIRDYIRARLEAEAAFLKEAQARLGQVTRTNMPNAEQRSIEVIRWAAGSTVHPVDYQAELRTLQHVLAERPGLPDRINEMGGIVKEKVSRWYDDAKSWFVEKSSQAKPGRE